MIGPRIVIAALFSALILSPGAAQFASQVVNSVAVGNITGFGTGVATALGINVGTAGAPLVKGTSVCADLSNGATGCSTATGTSGATIPLLNVANTWSANQAFGNGTGTPVAFVNGGTSAGQGGSFQIFSNGTLTGVVGVESAVLGSGTSTNTAITAQGARSVSIYTNGNIRLTADSSGGIQLPGLASTSAAQTGTLCWTTGTGNITVDTTTTCLLSSARFKHDIQPLDIHQSLATVLALRPVSYEYNDPMVKGQQVGFVAEDVAQLDDRLVSREPDGSPRAVRYQQLTADLAAAIQAQQKQIDELKRKVH